MEIHAIEKTEDHEKIFPFIHSFLPWKEKVGLTLLTGIEQSDFPDLLPYTFPPVKILITAQEKEIYGNFTILPSIRRL